MGGADCHYPTFALLEGLVAQPSNTVTSLAYLLIGIVILVYARRARLDPMISAAAP